MEQISQPRPDSGLEFQVNVLKKFEVVPYSLETSTTKTVGALSSRGAPIERHASDLFSCRVNSAHIRQSRPGIGLGLSHLQTEILLIVPVSIGSGTAKTVGACAGFLSPKTNPTPCWTDAGRGGACSPCFCKLAKLEQISQSGPDSGLGFQVNVLKTFYIVPHSLENSTTKTVGSCAGLRSIAMPCLNGRG